MGIGTLLVVIGLILAIIAAFVPVHSVRLLAGAVVLVALGVLVGVGTLGVG